METQMTIYVNRGDLGGGGGKRLASDNCKHSVINGEGFTSKMHK